MAKLSKKIESSEGIRADVVVQQLTGNSRAIVRGMFDHRCVTVNGSTCLDAGTSVAAGDVIAVDYDKERKYKEIPKARQSKVFELVFEDDWLMVVDKKAGYLTVPTEHRETNTLVGALSVYLTRGGSRRKLVSIVHRLDRDTSGLLVFAKDEDTAEMIRVQFAARKPMREYIAIVAGHLREKTGTFQSNLYTDQFLNQKSTNDADKGKLAITHYKVVDELEDATVVSVTLETGRRNQIRVHFAEKGHPVIGDVRYKTELAAHPKWRLKRLALHAAVLGFDHPVTKKKLVFRSTQPLEFSQFIKSTKAK